MSDEIDVVVTQPITRLQQIEQSLVTELEREQTEAEPVETEETEAAPETVDEGETNTEDSAPEEEDVEQEERPKKSKGGGFQKRIDKLTKKASELERQLEAERAEKAQLLANKPPEAQKAPTDDGAPNPEEFDTYAEYNRALVRFEARQIREEEKRQEAQQRINAELADAGKKFEEKLKAVAKTHDDFDEVFDPDLTVNGAMQAVMLDSDVGAEIAYYLCKNPEEAAEIAAMNPIQSARKMALIEAKLSKSEETPEQRKRISKAPTPVNTTGGTSNASGGKDPNKMSPEEFGVWFKKTYGRR